MLFNYLLLAAGCISLSGNSAGDYEERLKIKATGLKALAEQKGYRSDRVFLIDMKEASGLARFAVYDLKKNRVEKTGLVTHGRCNKWWLTGRSYSNKIGSGCTSLGVYKIGAAYQGKFGLAYKLYGLSASNNNAYARYVVLHAMDCVPEKPVYPGPICQSDGCPAVSASFLQYLHKIIQEQKKPILLQIYE
ncbi:murein L,D-transpeptidase catalytic domain-containing protein [Flavihumibacter sp. CACIAM 22H1]|uniref:murein L,D-transpeptidase catalytic domain-containing protein n=1 Tax=Flavihumibacter sp. CACIAM 22H1 TaxID=1812911 RepID=UPI000AC2FD34|nr:murein L,D-transpeptidase catalytic domain family protein [Flavihumibacter sp. CACIAM 22H1]